MNGIAKTEMMDIELTVKKERGGMSPMARAFKRAFDFTAALGGLIVFSPLYVLLCILIWWEDKHSPIFRQERIGKGGKPFMLYKFRSMRVTAEEGGQPLLYHKGDERLTCIGRFLREHHLDELPQLWNVVKGDMSFVGPRPERKFFIDQIMAVNPDYEKLYRLRPGLFSYATLYNGYTDTMEKMLERLRMDLEYLETCSLWLDTKIIFLTVWSILTGKKF